MENVTDMKGISRTGSGFIVQMKRPCMGVKICRWFKKLRDAELFRDELVARYGEIRRRGSKRGVVRLVARKNNTCGVAGVKPIYNQHIPLNRYKPNRGFNPRMTRIVDGKPIRGYRATWQEDGKLRYKDFTFRQNGDLAFIRACACRSQAVKGKIQPPPKFKLSLAATKLLEELEARRC